MPLPGFVKSILCDARGDGAVESRLNEVGLRLRAHEDNRDRHVDEAEAISLKPLLRCDRSNGRIALIDKHHRCRTST